MKHKSTKPDIPDEVFNATVGEMFTTDAGTELFWIQFPDGEKHWDGRFFIKRSGGWLEGVQNIVWFRMKVPEHITKVEKNKKAPEDLIPIINSPSPKYRDE